MMSSVSPSATYSLSLSPMIANGSTSIAGQGPLSANGGILVAAGDIGPAKR
jgi:hypothetical protein